MVISCYNSKHVYCDVHEQVTILHAWFLPAVLEKARMGLLLRDFDLAHETSQQILQKVCSSMTFLPTFVNRFPSAHKDIIILCSSVLVLSYNSSAIYLNAWLVKRMCE